MSLSQHLWLEAQPLARRSLEHPFVQGLGDGTLSPERYRVFIAQDAFFLDVFARGYAYCAAAAPDRRGLEDFRTLFNGILDELDLHAKAAAELDIDLDQVEPLPSTLAYTGFLEACIHEGAGPAITVASMTPCMRLYSYLGQELSRRPVADPYRDWVETYAADENEQLAQTVEALLDRYGSEQPERERAQYLRAMELEYGFFDGAWRAVEENEGPRE